MPATRHGQAASCWLIETGNGGKFLFDIGTGSMANVAALMIPYQYLDKVFLSYLHTDHMGDIDALWAGGWTAGRPNALQVWGLLGRPLNYYVEVYSIPREGVRKGFKTGDYTMQKIAIAFGVHYQQ